MKKGTTLAMLAALPATAAIAAVPYHKMPPGFDAPPIRAEPIAGIVNQYWYNYQADILEAEKELSSDLRHATDSEDRWDAWDEWTVEVVDRSEARRVGKACVSKCRSRWEADPLKKTKKKR